MGNHRSSYPSEEIHFAQAKEEFTDQFEVDYKMLFLKEQLEKLKKDISLRKNLSVPYLRQLGTEIDKCHDELKQVIEEHVNKCFDNKPEEENPIR
jgi:hypothetical protein